ncbi:unnamed protein product [Caenorhabditis sp. 36 PRJEB53466]|nr:unnamed protein product [Caenorhabditis sp. 36 PRJEB53466]
MTPHRRRPLPANARPSKSSLKIPPEYLNYSMSDEMTSPDQYASDLDSSKITDLHEFRRNGFGRRSERFTSATQAKFEESNGEIGERKDGVGDESTDGKLKRNSFLRRSLNALRSKTRRSYSGCGAATNTTSSFLNPNSQIPEEDEVVFIESAPKKNMKSLWRRLFLSSKKGGAKVTDKVQLLSHVENAAEPVTVSFVRLENQHDDPTTTTTTTMHSFLSATNFALGYYTGIGRKFERVASGSEITMVVFGHAHAGKTTFVRGIRQLFLDGTTSSIRVIPIAERYKLAGIGVMPYPVGDNRLPHFVSLVISPSPDVEYVLDIIDPEYDDTNLPQSYMDSCDAAILLIDARNCASLLSNHQIQRNMKTGQVQYELVMNVPSEESGQPRQTSVLETMAAKKTTVREMCVLKLDKHAVEEMLFSICERVMTARQPRSLTSSPVTVTATATAII